ncbi:histone chaperone domain CHZ-domain-containing protein [Phaeosphaeriaceae sp. PMI808]|nr:histone chaperone domain CHZ-domain-containing protein [Phaeosphaeriaceae sp. PMI808]
MSAPQEDQHMEGVQNPATEGKGKGKQVEGETMEESMDDDSSDESGAEDQVLEEPDEDNMEEIDTANVIGSRTRGKNIDFAKANQELGEDEDEDDDDDFVDPDDQMKD